MDYCPFSRGWGLFFASFHLPQWLFTYALAAYDFLSVGEIGEKDPAVALCPSCSHWKRKTIPGPSHPHPAPANTTEGGCRIVSHSTPFFSWALYKFTRPAITKDLKQQKCIVLQAGSPKSRGQRGWLFVMAVKDRYVSGLYLTCR